MCFFIFSVPLKDNGTDYYWGCFQRIYHTLINTQQKSDALNPQLVESLRGIAYHRFYIRPDISDWFEASKFLII